MRERTRVLAVASTALLLTVLVWFNYSALLPIIVAEWGLTGVEAGVVFAAFQAGYVLAVLPVGWLADRRSRRRVIAAGATGTGLFSLGFAFFAVDVTTGALLRFLAGLCMAGVYVPGMRFLSDWYPERVRGRALGIYAGAFSLSTGLSFLLASPIAAALDWRIAIGATSVGGLLAGPLVLLGTRDHPDASVATAGLDLSILSNRPYRSAVGIYAGHTWELFGARNWLLAFLLATPALASTGRPTVVAGLLVGVTLSIGGLSNLAAGWASDHLGRRRTILLTLGTSATISAALGTLAWNSFPVLAGVVLLYGLVLTADSSPTSTAVTEVVSDGRIGVALALQTLVGFGTTVVSPVVFGVALDLAGFDAAFLTLAAGAGFGLLSLAAFSRRQRTHAKQSGATGRRT
ncbi:MFS transporter [Halomarina pelagica]|uniref:MFS transporter n=1 Tax=Halomarina pelagica TaxID=2961599 RepID=UPI0020C557CF|nr:MFS transporter [Halomarina sp. BND7]